MMILHLGIYWLLDLPGDPVDNKNLLTTRILLYPTMQIGGRQSSRFDPSKKLYSIFFIYFGNLTLFSSWLNVVITRNIVEQHGTEDILRTQGQKWPDLFCAVILNQISILQHKPCFLSSELLYCILMFLSLLRWHNMMCCGIAIHITCLDPCDHQQERILFSSRVSPNR